MSSLYNFIRENHLLATIENAAEKRSSILNLSHSELNEIPQQLLGLNDLNKLYLNDNNLKVLPDDLWRLERLKLLTLDYNVLSSIPRSIGQLSCLVCLNLSYNPLGKLLPEIGLLHKLEVLWLNHTQLEALPAEISNCVELDTLGARGNFLKELPREIGQLRRLRWLTLQGNLLSSTPDGMQGLSDLIHLNLINNQFEKMPKLDELKNLEYIFLSQNYIQEIDVGELQNLHFVKKIDVTDNPISNLYECRNVKNLKMDDYKIQPEFNPPEDSESEDWELSAPSSELDVSETSEEELGGDDPLAAVMPQIARFTANGV